MLWGILRAGDTLRILGAGDTQGQGCSQLGTTPSTVFLVSRRKSLC